MKSRAAARSTLAWVFGLAVSILFLALWGRSVVSDTETLAESLSPLSRSEFVADLIADWMTEEMVGTGAEPAMVQATVEYMVDSSSVGQTFDRLVAEIVMAAASGHPAGSQVDVAGLVEPSIPDLTVGMQQLGYPVSQDEVADFVRALDPLVIRQPGSGTIVGPGSPTATRLGTAALLATLVLLSAGYGFVALSDDRMGAIRSLLTRIALGGVSFAIFLRLGSWVLDPSGGRAPVSATVSALTGSKWAVPLQVALVAAALAATTFLVRQRIRRVGGSPQGPGKSKPRREQSRSLSRSR